MYDCMLRIKCSAFRCRNKSRWLWSPSSSSIGMEVIIAHMRCSLSLSTSTQPHRCATALIDYLQPHPDINWPQHNSMRWPHNMLCLCCMLDNVDSATTPNTLCERCVRVVFRFGKPFNSEHDFPVHWPIRNCVFPGPTAGNRSSVENHLGTVVLNSINYTQLCWDLSSSICAQICVTICQQHDLRPPRKLNLSHPLMSPSEMCWRFWKNHQQARTSTHMKTPIHTHNRHTRSHSEHV